MENSMNYNFQLLEARVLDALDKTDLEKIKYELQKIKTPVICTGVGGSNTVSNFASKVIASKNNVITCTTTPRDLIYMPIDLYDNLLICSYSGKNYGVDIAMKNDLKKYILSRQKIDDVINLTYSMNISEEHSFISLAATLIPLSILLAYYNDGDISIIKKVLTSKNDYDFKVTGDLEIFGGYEVNTATKFLESTMIESGISPTIVHDKYDYCHGRSSLSYHHDSSAIYFDCNKQLDKVLLTDLYKYYKDYVCLQNRYDDPIINDFYLTYQSMLLSKTIASNGEKDLSKVNYSPFVKKLYKYKGEM